MTSAGPGGSHAPTAPGLRAAENALQQALRGGDVDTLDALLDEVAAYVGPDGVPVARADDLAAHRSGHLRVPGVEEREADVVVVGTTGVTRVLLTVRGTLGGEPFTVTLRYTRAWHHADGRWRVVAAHASAAG